MTENPTIVLFDGTCGMCSRLVRFIVRHETSKALLFSSNSSNRSRELCETYGLETAVQNTIVVIHKERVFTESDAVILIASFLDAPYRWAGLLRLVPRFLRNAAYRIVARYRHVLYPRDSYDVCEYLSAQDRARILE